MSRRKRRLKDKYARTIRKYARWRRKHTPPAEKWFQEKWAAAGEASEQDQYNVPFGHIIPDCINLVHKYVIEIDEEYHRTPAMREKDARRDSWLGGRGFQVFRIPEFDEQAFQLVLERVRMRKLHPAVYASPIGPRPRVVLISRRIDGVPTRVPVSVRKPPVFVPRVIVRRAKPSLIGSE